MIRFYIHLCRWQKHLFLLFLREIMLVIGTLSPHIPNFTAFLYQSWLFRRSHAKVFETFEFLIEINIYIYQYYLRFFSLLRLFRIFFKLSKPRCQMSVPKVLPRNAGFELVEITKSVGVEWVWSDSTSVTLRFYRAHKTIQLLSLFCKFLLLPWI